MDTENRKKDKRRKSKKVVKDEGQSLDQHNKDTRLMNNTVEGNLIMEELKPKDELQSMDHNIMDTGPIENLAEGNVTAKRKRKRKAITRAENEDGVQTEMDARSHAEGNLTTLKSKVKEAQNIGLAKMSTETSAEGNVNIESPKTQDETQSMYQTNMDKGEAHSFSKGITPGKKRKTKKKARDVDEVQKQMDATSIENLDEGSLTIDKPKVEDECQSLGQNQTGSTENLAEVKVIIENPETQDEDMDQNRMDTWQLVENPAQGNVTEKRRKKQKGMKEKVNDEVHSERDTTRSTHNFAEENVTVKKKQKPKKTNKEKVKDGSSGRMDAGSTNNLAEVNVNIRIPEPRVEVQSMTLKVMDVGSTENPTKGSMNFVIPKVQDENQSIENSKMDTGPIHKFAEGNVTVKRKKKPKKEKANVMDKLSGIMGAGSTENLVEVMDAGSTGNPTKGSVTVVEIPKVQDENQPTQNFAEGNVTVKRKKKPKKEKANGMDELSGRMDAGSTENLAEVLTAGSTGNPTKGCVTFEMPKVQDKIQSIDNQKIESRPTQSFAEENVTVKKRKKRQKKEKSNGMDELSGRMDAGSTENLAEVMNAGSTGNPTKGSVTFEIPKVQDEIQSNDNQKMDTRPKQNFAGENVTVKRKKKPKKEKADGMDELSSRMDPGSTENLAEVMNAGSTGSPTKGSVAFDIPKVQDENQSIENQNFVEKNVTKKRKKKPKKEKEKAKDELSGRMDAETTEDLTKGSATSENPKNKEEGQSMDKVKMDTGAAKDSTEEHVTGKRKKKRRCTRKQETVGEFLSVNQDGTMLSLDMSEGHPNILFGEKATSLNGLSQVSNEIILDEGIGHAEGRTATSTCNAFTVKDAEVLCPRTTPFASVRRKLLVLDINGLLGDIVFPPPKQCQADIKLCGRAVYRRPFCDDFLKFCFQNFYVGIWSSRTKRIIDVVVNYLLGDQRDKLVFCWDMTHSTPSAFKTLDNRHKPLVCKELKKIWEQDDPSWPWKRGDYNESNTLLLDDSPYKALLNPLHTAIFPHPYQYSDKNDNSLGPGGAIRVYLEGLLTSENVQKYVEQHPFGQMPINEQDPSWEFYDRVIKQMSNQVKDITPLSA